MIARESPAARLGPSSAAIFLGFSALVFYQLLIQSYPVVYWGDAHIRLALRDQLLVGHWLPLIQGVVFGVSKISTGLVVLRGALSLIALGSLGGMYRLAGRLFSPAVGLIAAALLATNLMFAALATVPYPDVLFAGLIFIALECLDEPDSPRRRAAGLIALNLACLARYEGWMLAGMFIVESAVGSFRSKPWRAAVLQTLKTTLSCSLAPLAWLAFGVSQAGGPIARLKAVVAFETVSAPQLLDDRLLARLNLDYLGDFAAQYFGLLKWQAHPLILMLAAGGVIGALILGKRRAPHLRILAFLVLDWSLLAFLQPWGFGNLRQPFVLQIFLILYAAFGLERCVHLFFDRLANLTGRSSPPLLRGSLLAIVAAAMTIFSARTAAEFVAGASQEPDFSVPAAAGAWLMPRLAQDDAVLVLSDDTFQAYALAAYIPIPFDRILEDRFDNELISSLRSPSGLIYVVALYKSRAGLSKQEGSLLEGLESGRIQAQSHRIGSTRVWVVSDDALVSSR